MSEIQPESDAERVNRLVGKPESADINDVRWLAMRCAHQSESVELLKRGAGRFFGLKEASEIIEAAAHKEVIVRFLAGKREHAQRAINSKLLTNVANLIRRYADDAENQRGPFAPKQPVAP